MTLHMCYPPVFRQAIHLKDEDTVTYYPGKEEVVLLKRATPNFHPSMLIAYFHAVEKENAEPIPVISRIYKGVELPEANHLRYIDFPKYFTHKVEKEGHHVWNRRLSTAKHTTIPTLCPEFTTLVSIS